MQILFSVSYYSMISKQNQALFRRNSFRLYHLYNFIPEIIAILFQM